MRSLSLVSILALAWGCTAVHDLTPAIHADDPRWEIVDGCRVVEVTAEDTPLVYDTTAYAGSWVDLDHEATRASTLYVDVVSTPETYVDGDWGGGYLATSGHPGHWPANGFGSLDGLAYSATESVTPPTGMPVYGTHASVFLFPTGWTYRVRLCTEMRDAFPTCHDTLSCPVTQGCGVADGSGYACACTPACVVDADCPVPSSGTASPRCFDGRCAIPCDASVSCPAGQQCYAATDLFGTSVCMTPP